MQWALNILKKPIVTVNWLYQCWNEHRVVPQESYKVLPFSGLMICVTRIPAGCYVLYLFTAAKDTSFLSIGSNISPFFFFCPAHIMSHSFV